jgi:hypothetical protein
LNHCFHLLSGELARKKKRIEEKAGEGEEGSSTINGITSMPGAYSEMSSSELNFTLNW